MLNINIVLQEVSNKEFLLCRTLNMISAKMPYNIKFRCILLIYLELIFSAFKTYYCKNSPTIMNFLNNVF